MAIKINEENFSNLMFPPNNCVLIGVDSSDGQLKLLNSNGEIEIIQKISGGGDATGESVIIGTIVRQSGNYYLGHGREVTPSGDYAHAFGYRTIASGNHSHTSGYYTIASGLYSYCGGIGSDTHEVIASGKGSYNYSFTSALGTSNNAADYGVILGGLNNSMSSTANYGVILGGLNNSMSSTANYSVIVGGHDNDITSTYGTIVGGYENTISGNNVVILAGKNFLGSQNDSVYVPNLVLAITGATGYSEPGTVIYDGTNFKGRNNSTWVTLESPTSTQISNWNTAYSWGPHAGLYAPKSSVNPIGGTNGQLQYNNNGAYGGASFIFNVSASGDYINHGRFRLGYIGNTSTMGMSIMDTRSIATYYSPADRFEYAGGVLKISTGNFMVDDSYLPVNNTPPYFITYDGTNLGVGRPTTLSQYGITDASTSVTETLNFDLTYQDKNITIVELNGRKMGKVYSITGNIKLDNNGGNRANRVVAKLITNFTSAGYLIRFTISDDYMYENVHGYVDTDGYIYASWEKTNIDYNYFFNAIWITP